MKEILNPTALKLAKTLIKYNRLQFDSKTGKVAFYNGTTLVMTVDPEVSFIYGDTINITGIVGKVTLKT